MPDIDAIGIVGSDLRRAVSFYRAVGLAFPEGAEESEHGHAEVALTGGMRLMLDTEAVRVRRDMEQRFAPPAAAVAAQ